MEMYLVHISIYNIKIAILLLKAPIPLCKLYFVMQIVQKDVPYFFEPPKKEHLFVQVQLKRSITNVCVCVYVMQFSVAC